jgi:hypothetical protein
MPHLQFLKFLGRGPIRHFMGPTGGFPEATNNTRKYICVIHVAL